MGAVRDGIHGFATSPAGTVSAALVGDEGTLEIACLRGWSACSSSPPSTARAAEHGAQFF